MGLLTKKRVITRYPEEIVVTGKPSTEDVEQVSMKRESPENPEWVYTATEGTISRPPWWTDWKKMRARWHPQYLFGSDDRARYWDENYENVYQNYVVALEPDPTINSYTLTHPVYELDTTTVASTDTDDTKYLRRNRRTCTCFAIMLGFLLVALATVPVVLHIILQTGKPGEVLGRVGTKLKLVKIEYEEEMSNTSSVAFQQLAESFSVEIDYLYNGSDVWKYYDSCQLKGAENGSILVHYDLLFKIIKQEIPSRHQLKDILYSVDRDKNDSTLGVLGDYRFKIDSIEFIDTDTVHIYKTVSPGEQRSTIKANISSESWVTTESVPPTTVATRHGNTTYDKNSELMDRYNRNNIFDISNELFDVPITTQKEQPTRTTDPTSSSHATLTTSSTELSDTKSMTKERQPNVLTRSSAAPTFTQSPGITIHADREKSITTGWPHTTNDRSLKLLSKETVTKRSVTDVPSTTTIQTIGTTRKIETTEFSSQNIITRTPTATSISVKPTTEITVIDVSEVPDQTTNLQSFARQTSTIAHIDETNGKRSQDMFKIIDHTEIHDRKFSPDSTQYSTHQMDTTVESGKTVTTPLATTFANVEDRTTFDLLNFYDFSTSEAKKSTAYTDTMPTENNLFITTAEQAKHKHDTYITTDSRTKLPVRSTKPPAISDIITTPTGISIDSTTRSVGTEPMTDESTSNNTPIPKTDALVTGIVDGFSDKTSNVSTANDTKEIPLSTTQNILFSMYVDKFTTETMTNVPEALTEVTDTKTSVYTTPVIRVETTHVPEDAETFTTETMTNVPEVLTEVTDSKTSVYTTPVIRVETTDVPETMTEVTDYKTSVYTTPVTRVETTHVPETMTEVTDYKTSEYTTPVTRVETTQDALSSVSNIDQTPVQVSKEADIFAMTTDNRLPENTTGSLYEEQYTEINIVLERDGEISTTRQKVDKFDKTTNLPTVEENLSSTAVIIENTTSSGLDSPTPYDYESTSNVEYTTYGSDITTDIDTTEIPLYRTDYFTQRISMAINNIATENDLSTASTGSIIETLPVTTIRSNIISDTRIPVAKDPFLALILGKSTETTASIKRDTVKDEMTTTHTTPLQPIILQITTKPQPTAPPVTIPPKSIISQLTTPIHEATPHRTAIMSHITTRDTQMTSHITTTLETTTPPSTTTQQLTPLLTPTSTVTTPVHSIASHITAPLQATTTPFTPPTESTRLTTTMPVSSTMSYPQTTMQLLHTTRETEPTTIQRRRTNTTASIMLKPTSKSVSENREFIVMDSTSSNASVMYTTQPPNDVRTISVENVVTETYTDTIMRNVTDGAVHVHAFNISGIAADTGRTTELGILQTTQVPPIVDISTVGIDSITTDLPVDTTRKQGNVGENETFVGINTMVETTTTNEITTDTATITSDLTNYLEYTTDSTARNDTDTTIQTAVSDIPTDSQFSNKIVVVSFSRNETPAPTTSSVTEISLTTDDNLVTTTLLPETDSNKFTTENVTDNLLEMSTDINISGTIDASTAMPHDIETSTNVQNTTADIPMDVVAQDVLTTPDTGEIITIDTTSKRNEITEYPFNSTSSHEVTTNAEDAHTKTTHLYTYATIQNISADLYPGNTTDLTELIMTEFKITTTNVTASSDKESVTELHILSGTTQGQMTTSPTRNTTKIDDGENVRNDVSELAEFTKNTTLSSVTGLGIRSGPPQSELTTSPIDLTHANSLDARAHVSTTMVASSTSDKTTTLKTTHISGDVPDAVNTSKLFQRTTTANIVDVTKFESSTSLNTPSTSIFDKVSTDSPMAQSTKSINTTEYNAIGLFHMSESMETSSSQTSPSISNQSTSSHTKSTLGSAEFSVDDTSATKKVMSVTPVEWITDVPGTTMPALPSTVSANVAIITSETSISTSLHTNDKSVFTAEKTTTETVPTEETTRDVSAMAVPITFLVLPSSTSNPPVMKNSSSVTGSTDNSELAIIQSIRPTDIAATSSTPTQKQTTASIKSTTRKTSGGVWPFSNAIQSDFNFWFNPIPIASAATSTPSSSSTTSLEKATSMLSAKTTTTKPTTTLPPWHPDFQYIWSLGDDVISNLLHGDVLKQPDAEWAIDETNNSLAIPSGTTFLDNRFKTIDGSRLKPIHSDVASNRTDSFRVPITSVVNSSITQAPKSEWSNADSDIQPTVSDTNIAFTRTGTPWLAVNTSNILSSSILTRTSVTTSPVTSNAEGVVTTSTPGTVRPLSVKNVTKTVVTDNSRPTALETNNIFKETGDMNSSPSRGNTGTVDGSTISAGEMFRDQLSKSTVLRESTTRTTNTPSTRTTDGRFWDSNSLLTTADSFAENNILSWNPTIDRISISSPIITTSNVNPITPTSGTTLNSFFNLNTLPTDNSRSAGINTIRLFATNLPPKVPASDTFVESNILPWEPTRARVALPNFASAEPVRDTTAPVASTLGSFANTATLPRRSIIDIFAETNLLSRERETFIGEKDVAVETQPRPDTFGDTNTASPVITPRGTIRETLRGLMNASMDTDMSPVWRTISPITRSAQVTATPTSATEPPITTTRQTTRLPPKLAASDTFVESNILPWEPTRARVALPNFASAEPVRDTTAPVASTLGRFANTVTLPRSSIIDIFAETNLLSRERETFLGEKKDVAVETQPRPDTLGDTNTASPVITPRGTIRETLRGLMNASMDTDISPVWRTISPITRSAKVTATPTSATEPPITTTRQTTRRTPETTAAPTTISGGWASFVSSIFSGRGHSPVDNNIVNTDADSKIPDAMEAQTRTSLELTPVSTTTVEQTTMTTGVVSSTARKTETTRSAEATLDISTTTERVISGGMNDINRTTSSPLDTGTSTKPPTVPGIAFVMTPARAILGQPVRLTWTITDTTGWKYMIIQRDVGQTTELIGAVFADALRVSGGISPLFISEESIFSEDGSTLRVDVPSMQCADQGTYRVSVLDATDPIVERRDIVDAFGAPVARVEAPDNVVEGGSVTGVRCIADLGHPAGQVYLRVRHGIEGQFITTAADPAFQTVTLSQPCRSVVTTSFAGVLDVNRNLNLTDVQCGVAGTPAVSGQSGIDLSNMATIRIIPASICTGRQNQLVAHPYTPCKYIDCRSITVLTCPGDTCFDTATEACVA